LPAIAAALGLVDGDRIEETVAQPLSASANAQIVNASRRILRRVLIITCSLDMRRPAGGFFTDVQPPGSTIFWIWACSRPTTAVGRGE
jgi:hypothetical protein